MCFNCSMTVETCAANHIHTFGHANYSKQMCLLVLLQNAYWHLILFLRMLYLCSFYLSEVYFCKANAMCCYPREVSDNPMERLV